jgi:hypothetical protein
MAAQSISTRRGIAKQLIFDADALALLRQLCASRKAQGRFVSELLRTEQRMREERQRSVEETADGLGQS